VIKVVKKMFPERNPVLNHHLAEGKVVLFQWSSTIFKEEFPVECQLTGFLCKRQPVLKKKRILLDTRYSS